MNNKSLKMKPKFEAVIEKYLEQTELLDFMRNPILPEVLVNPSFLVIPDLGHLLAICIYDLPEPEQFWKFTLEVIEDLFEIKASAGAETSIALIVLEHTPIQISLYNFALLERLSDGFLRLDFDEEQNQDQLKRFINNMISEHPVKKENIHLWNADSGARIANERRVFNRRFITGMFEDALRQDLHKPTFPTRLAIVDKITSFKNRSNNYTLFPQPKVNNIKELLINSLNPFYFTFDFGMIQGLRDTDEWKYIDRFRLSDWIGMGCSLINVMRGANTAYPHIRYLRRMFTYARFISFQAEANANNLVLRDPPPKMYMVIDGTVSGPSHDPQRYLRMLISSGWTPISLQDFTEQFFEGEL